MADPELVRTLDFILNRCDENDIGAVAEAVIRRRRQLTMFGGAANLPDPHKMAQELSAKMDISGAINGLNNSVRDMAMRIIKQEAPELTDAQVAELTAAWIPRPQGSQGAPQSPPPGDKGAQVPEGILRSMIDQFVAFSRGTLDQKEDQEL
ncbi:MAG: hypothetical protein LBT39_07005, partial [Treponema sp.]|nr:hypothetical protein [Treponema sp.]